MTVDYQTCDVAAWLTINRPPRVELYSPAGEVWVWGPADAAERVTGSALGFVLTVTQRKNWTETDLVAEGTVAPRWLDIAQVFAGAPSRRQPQVTRS